MDDDLSALFPWWATVDDADGDAPRRRALAWLDDPYARTLLETRLVRDDDRATMLDVLRRAFAEGDVPPWTDPLQMEAWLRGMAEGCAASIAYAERR